MSEGFLPSIYEPIVLAALRRDSGLVEMWMVPQRQRDLVRSLGQVECPCSHAVELADGWYALTPCPGCGAAL